MRRVLKDTGSIYLHCDPTASHYLKLLMDAILGKANFVNELIWYYTNASRGKRKFAKAHDIVFWYSKSQNNFVFNRDDVLVPFQSGMTEWRYTKGGQAGKEMPKGKTPDDVYILPSLNAMAKERLGYPTQKPLALMERIIRASSNEGDTVLDPFCGCGTTVHAAEVLGRKWLGIDISKFSTGLIRDRILHNFKYLNADDIDMRGTPDSVREARELARQDPFEFEKWVCGYIGAEGMFREPGERGADGGVDGVLKFFPIREGKKVKPEYAIVQVKGGRVSADNVKALHETVRRYEATAGVMVCFADQLGTVENQRVKATFKDAWGSYPVIQGFSVESLLSDGQLDLPLYGYKRRGAMLGL
ncbi:MAG: DNA methyltransferase [Chloroflexi bacterium]|nr:DNA methyltransferase [Chloroflexota bacterium]